MANSGGYNFPNYDSTISQVDLATMREERQINVAVNLHHLRLDKHGQLWVTSRGDYYDIPSNLFWLQADGNGQMQLAGQMDVEVSDMCLVGDSLYFYGIGYNDQTKQNTRSFGIVNVRRHQVVSSLLSDAQELQNMRMPYGIIVHPTNRDFYLMDAKNYVSSGELLHFHADGTFDYKVRTGDIPAHAAFLINNEIMK